MHRGALLCSYVLDLDGRLAFEQVWRSDQAPSVTFDKMVAHVERATEGRIGLSVIFNPINAGPSSILMSVWIAAVEVFQMTSLPTHNFMRFCKTREELLNYIAPYIAQVIMEGGDVQAP